MAIINIGVDGENMEPLNGLYRFTANFYNSNGTLSTDPKFPQNQVYTTSTFVEPYYIPLNVADGDYTISGIKVRISYKEKILEKDLSSTRIICTERCTTGGISEIRNTTGNTWRVSLLNSIPATYNWNVYDSTEYPIASGTGVNVTGSNFFVILPELPEGSYLFELLGVNCVGKYLYNLQVGAVPLPDCIAGPTLISTSIATTGQTRFLFDGEGIFAIRWRIKQNNITVRSGVLKHISIAQQGDPTFDSSTPTISYDNLLAGNYRLEIEGELCRSSVSALNYTITDTPLSFTNASPAVTGGDNNYTMSLSINKIGTFKVVVLNSSSGIYYSNEDRVFLANTPVIFNNLPNGEYLVKVGTLETLLVLGPAGSVDPQSGVFEFIMNTTGSGFSPDESTGIGPDFIPRIEAFNYSWGWGITGISICMPWKDFEPTPGNYRLDGIQKNIDYCSARGLTLSYRFYPLRHENDTMIHPDEVIIGAFGNKMKLGADVQPSMGCDRTNIMIAECARQIATKLKTYPKAGHLILAGGHTEELVNGITSGNKELTDFSPDNLRRFDAWVTARGLTTAGYPPSVNGIDWPHPDWSNPLGVEFGRFLTYNIRKTFDNFRNAVKSVSNLHVLYYYAACGNTQQRATSNPNYNWIAENSDGMYGTDGGGVTDKLMVNAVNLGTFPNRMSVAELDPNDVPPRWEGDPPFCFNQIDYAYMKSTMTSLYNRGTKVIDLAMSFCPAEIAGMSNLLQELHQTYIGKPYTRPVVNSENTTTINVTDSYRQGAFYLSGVNPLTTYVKIVDTNFFGGVSPFVEGSVSNPQFEPFTVAGRSGEVWLPENYNTSESYSVIYALDGKTLFAKDNNSEGYWRLNERVQTLINEGKIKKSIIVSIDSDGSRLRDFLPNKPFEAMSTVNKNALAALNGGTPLADTYLTWLVSSLKPYIDNKYSTLDDKDNTVILGSDMGGLLALYAFGERPTVFGKVAALSPHYYGGNTTTNALPPKMVEYITTYFPDSTAGNKIYLDRGTEGVDVNYNTSQVAILSSLSTKGYTNDNLRSAVTQDALHNPTYWGNRVSGVLEFLLAPSSSGFRAFRHFQGHPDHLDVEFTGDDANWTGYDRSTITLQNGYEWWYIIGGVDVKRSTPLSNYKYESNNPLSILKYQAKIGLQTLNQYDPPNDGGYYDINAVKMLPNNTMAAMSYHCFTKYA